MTVTVAAADTSEEPSEEPALNAVLTTDKDTYNKNEDITVTLTVANDGEETVSGIKTEIALPGGLVLKSGSLTQGLFSLAAGESLKNMPTLNNTTEVTPVKNNNTPVIVLAVVILLLVCAFAFYVIRNRKAKLAGAAALFLCLAILGAAVLPLTANAADEEPAPRSSFTVTKNITVDGETVVISAEISYTKEVIYQRTVEEVEEKFESYCYDGPIVKINKLDGYKITEWAFAVTSGDKPLEIFMNITGQDVALADTYSYIYSSPDGQFKVSIAGNARINENNEYAIMYVNLPGCPEIKTIHIVGLEYFDAYASEGIVPVIVGE